MSTEEAKNAQPWLKALTERTEDEHAIAADHHQKGLGSVIQIIRSLRDSIVSEQEATNQLTQRIHKLNTGLFWVTFVIAGMTVVQLLVGLGIIGPRTAPSLSNLAVQEKKMTDALPSKKEPSEKDGKKADAQEPAWVLWEKASGVIGAGPTTNEIDEWMFQWKRDTQWECSREQETARNKLFNHFMRDSTVTYLNKTAKNKLFVVKKSGVISSVVEYEFICFPDTIDPREKKG